MVREPLLVLRRKASRLVDHVLHQVLVESHCVSHLGHLLIATEILKSYHVVLQLINHTICGCFSFIIFLDDNFVVLLIRLGDVLV